MTELNLENILQVLPNEWQPQIKLFNKAENPAIDGELTILLNQQPKHYFLECKHIHRKESLIHYAHSNPNQQRILVDRKSVV